MTDVMQAPEAPEAPTSEIVPENLWKVRLGLAWTGLVKNWKLFRTNSVGVVGLLIIGLFGFMATIQPILLGGLGPFTTVAMFSLMWPLTAAAVWPLIKNLHHNRRATIGITAGLAIVVVLLINVAVGGAWQPRTYDPVVGTEANPTTLIKTVVNEVTDPDTEMSTREAILFPTETGAPPLPGDQVEVRLQPAPPDGRHWLGTDPLGRDVLSQLMKGAQSAFLLGILAALVTVFFATTVGALSAYFGGWIDTSFMRLADLLLMLPALAILIVMSSVLRFQLWHLAVLLGVLGGFGGVAIVLKSQALAVKVKPFIEAARVAGGSSARIIFTHIVPNVMPLSFLYMMFTVTGAIQTEAALSFLGLLNIDMSWGLMIQLAQNQGYFLTGSDFWWLVFPSGMAVTLMAAAFFLVGRAMDEVINPRLRKR